ncbi:hypothetical protein XU06_29825 (plasmid) [Rhodococcus erythropolis]|uniref:putative quinol monooxygenase n=1 Tax=Rhodococcus erythropolis TaxID=1833 RepID=UPI00061B7EAE|nr:putative quinol monooxygenase [Rhodococcus erythropolis]AKE01152.1 hypothetical protein XU06_29825 [Rhodococcus erythropolis]
MDSPDRPVIGVVTLRPIPGREKEVEQACRDAVRATHEESGCQRFALHRINTDGGGLAIIEKWASSQALEEHLQSPAFAHFGDALNDALVGPPEFISLDPLTEGDPVLGEI